MDFSSIIHGTPISNQEIVDFVHGRTNQSVMEYLIGAPIDSSKIPELIQQKEQIYRQLCLDLGDRFKLSPGAIELLDYLVAQNIPHTIATSSEGTNLRFFFEHLGLDRWFDIQQVVYDDLVRPGKPAPDCYLLAAQNLGLKPDQCVVIEDSLAGIDAAYAAGIGHIIALGPLTRHQLLKEYEGVDEVVENLGQVAAWELFPSTQ